MEDRFSERQPTWSTGALPVVDEASRLKLKLPLHLKQPWESGLRTNLETKLNQDHFAGGC